MSESEIHTLLKLLDDSNERNVCWVMIALLQYGDKLQEQLKELQESSNPLLRRRIHQLQAILKFRQQRGEFATQLRDNRLELLEGLIRTHLLWYDCDSATEIRESWDKLLQYVRQFTPLNLEKLAYCLWRREFIAAARDEFQPDCFCIGAILEEKLGADFILCAIAAALAEADNFSVKIVQHAGKFALWDDNVTLLIPADGWKLSQINQRDAQKLTQWSTTPLIKLALSNLFLIALESNSFRYISIIGKCLAVIGGENDTDFLPFPYTTAPQK